MNKHGLPLKMSIITAVRFGLIVLGFGLVCFALMNIVQQKFATRIIWASSSSAPEQGGDESQSTVVSAEAMQNGQKSETPVSDESLYPVYPSEGEVVGSLAIPALELELPIIQGTGRAELREGAGHFIQSVLPGEEDNCVISGHRDTIFAGLGELEIGDQLIVQTSAGTFTYEVSGTRVVDKDDKTVIVPTDHAVLTLTTCYPFIYAGPAPERYIVSADIVAN